MKNSFISIVSAVFNEEKNIYRTLKSLKKQKYKNFEYIVIDNNSSDKTIEIIKKFTADFNIIIISEADKGIYFAWNKALKIFHGDFIAFIGAGDEYINSKSLLRLVQEISEDNTDYVHAKYQYGNKIYGEHLVWGNFKKYMTIMHSGALTSRNFIETNGFFNEEYYYASDYEYLLRSKGNINDIFVDEVVVRMLEYGVTNTKATAIYEAYQIKNKLKLNTSIENFFQFIFLLTKFYLKRLVHSKLIKITLPIK